MDEFYIYVSNEDSLDFYPNNKGTDFTVCLPYKRSLSGSWSCSLKEIFIEKFETRKNLIYVEFEGCIPSYINGGYSPILRLLHLKRNNKSIFRETFNDSFYVGLRMNDLEEVRICIRGGEDSLVKINKVVCTLHFRKDG